MGRSSIEDSLGWRNNEDIGRLCELLENIRAFSPTSTYSVAYSFD